MAGSKERHGSFHVDARVGDRRNCVIPRQHVPYRSALGLGQTLIRCYTNVLFSLTSTSELYRLLRAVVLAVLPLLAGERDGRVFSRSMALPHQPVSLLLHAHLHPVVCEPVSVRHEVETACPVRHRGQYIIMRRLIYLQFGES